MAASRGMDLRSMIGAVINFSKSKANEICTAPCDGLVLKMHYRWTFFMLLGTYFTVYYSWLYKDVMVCVSHYNADMQVRLDYMNICLSYPYVDGKDNTRRYLLFYRWIHWVFLVLAGIYYIPRKVSKNVENTKFKSLLEDVAQNSNRYDIVENQVFQCVDLYMNSNVRTHNGLYFKYILLNVLSLIIDIFTLYFLDFVLQGYFLQYGFHSYPFERDPKTFKDFMSSAFPPFATCELDSVNQITAKRKETLGCHLTIMELYEKVFLLVWFWLILLMTVTSLYIVFICMMMIPRFRYYVLKPEKPIYCNLSIKTLIDGVNKNCKVGDIYILYRLKQYLSHARFYELLSKLSKERFWEIPNLPIDVEKPNPHVRRPQTKPARVNVVRKQVQCMQNIPNIVTLQ
ncbi:UNVERIFIED_CONTAM: hypothetical protein RMT77_011262 [Armadillidium vulgare]